MSEKGTSSQAKKRNNDTSNNYTKGVARYSDIASHDFVLTPGRYVGAAPLEEDGVPFEEKMRELSATLYAQMEESAKLDADIKKNLEQLGYGE